MLDDLGGWLSAQTWPDIKPDIEASLHQSFLHPYGFTVVRLRIEDFPGWTIRAHFWPRGQREVALDTCQFIHRHGWALLSRTLIGAVRHELFEVETATSGVDEWCEYSVESDFGAGVSTLRRVRCGVAAQLVETSVHTAWSGVTAVAGAAFHSTTLDGVHSPAVTLAATERRNRHGSTVLVRPDTPEVIVNARHSVPSSSWVLSDIDALYRSERGNADRWIGSVFIVQTGRLLVIRTYRFHQYWQPVGGQATASDRDPASTALREVLEEVGLHLHQRDLKYLGSAERDRGEGLIHAYVASAPPNWEPVVLTEEIVEHRWVAPAELLILPCFAATRKFAGQLVHDR